MIILLFLISIFLYSCGGGGNNEPVPVKPPYQINLSKEKELTTDRWHQSDQRAAYGDGLYLVVFKDDRENHNALHGEDIWGALLDANLNVIKEFPLIRRNGRDIGAITVYDPDNKRFIVAWTAYKGIESSSVSMASVTLTGNITVKEVAVANGFVEVWGLRKVKEGYALLFKDVWLTGGQDIGSKVLKIGVINHSFEPIKVLTVTDDSHLGMKVDPTGGAFDCIDSSCFVAYSMAKELLRDNSLHIYGRFVSLQSGVLQPEVRLTSDVYGKSASKTTPIVAAGKDRFLIAWRDWDSVQGSVSVDLSGRFVTLSGAIEQEILISDFRWDKNKPVTTGLNGMVYYATLTYSSAKNVFYALWSDSRGANPLNTGLFLRRIGEDKDCILVNNMPMKHKTVDLIVGEGNKMFATWTQSGVRASHGHFSDDIFGMFLP